MTKKKETPVKKTNLKENLLQAARTAQHYSVLVFLLFLIGIYGFLAWRVISLNQAQADPAEVAKQLKTAKNASIDPEVIRKIQQLQDNSVSVQSLFDEARSNPFQE